MLGQEALGGFTDFNLFQLHLILREIKGSCVGSNESVHRFSGCRQ